MKKILFILLLMTTTPATSSPIIIVTTFGYLMYTAVDGFYVDDCDFVEEWMNNDE